MARDRRLPPSLRHFLALTAAAALLAYVALYSTIRPELQPIRSDGYCYYVYLPSWIIYHDLSFDALALDWYGGAFPEEIALRRSPAGRWLNPCPIGTALLMSPFFVAAHLLTYWSNLPPDGFSLYYQHGAGLAGLAYFLAGLAVVGRTLSRHFSRGVVLATLACLTWGTNLFHYGVFDSTFSHAFSFFLIAVWAAAVERWWERDTWRRTLTVAVIAALIVLVRHPNVVFLLLLPAYGVTRWRDLERRGRDLWDRRASLAAAAVAVVALVLPQLALYRWVNGSWFASPYRQLGFVFRFSSPHLFGVLASTQKGLFFWSPVLLLAVAGFVVALGPLDGFKRDACGRCDGCAERPSSGPSRAKRGERTEQPAEGDNGIPAEPLAGWAKQMALAVAVVFAIDAYLIASWAEWQFGASFGHRAFTDGLALAAPLIASAFEWSPRRLVLRRAVAVFASCAVALSIAQMVQYWIGILPMADTTWAQYRDLFLRFR